MNLDEIKKEYEKAKLDYNQVTSSAAKRGIANEMNNLKNKIDDEERRLSSVLKVRTFNGIEYE